MNTERPRISVVVPCFRHARFLPAAVGSLVAQTYPHWECIIVNDGSPDDTSEVTRQLIARFPQHRIRLVEQANQGPPASRNAGAAASSGELLLPLDADDMLHPEMLTQTSAALEERPSKSIAYTDLAYFEAECDEIAFSSEPFQELTRRNTFPVTSLVRRVLFDRVGGYRESMRDGYDDWDFWLGCARHGAEAIHVKGALFLHRVGYHGLPLDAAQKRDTWLKACLVQQNESLFLPLSRKWASVLLSRREKGDLVPPLNGQSFVPLHEIPNDSEALADLGTIAIWDGDIECGIRNWAEACCHPTTTCLFHAQITQAVGHLGLKDQFAEALKRVHPAAKDDIG